ncbi:MAG: UvrD-helicase domain-containing protein [Clostridia bacterium]|nr:UvrD-helicase domain-containing protein [Clostridia bacterium]
MDIPNGEETMRADEFNTLKRSLLQQYFHRLNAEQREAVFRIQGPLLVLAGAGSGKTTVLVNRIANILLFGNTYHSDRLPENAESVYRDMQSVSGSDPAELKRVLREAADKPTAPYRVLCITFTNKAANEFKERLEKLLGDSARDIWAGTFHSVCARILRRHIHLLGYTGSFTIYDEDDKKKLMSACMKRKHVDERILSVRNVIRMISAQKEKGFGPEDMAANAGRNRLEATAAGVYELYQEELKASNAVDFDDLILLTNRLFAEYPDILRIYQDQFDYVLVDEFQDTNPSQNDLVVRFAGYKKNVCVVGDDDQSIYSFRGATVENILRFDSTFPGAAVIRLERNYRSTSHILNAANAVISHNVERKGKNLWTDAGAGAPVRVERQSTQLEEAGFIASEIRNGVRSGEREYRDYAVLYRVTAVSNTLEQALVRNRIPYRICGGLRFNERKEIKDVISYLSVIDNPADPLRFARILNVPKRGIGDTTLERVSAIAAAEGCSPFDIAEHAVRYPELSRSAVKLTSFTDLIRSLQRFAEGNTVEALTRRVLEETGYLKQLREEALADGDVEGERERNVMEFVSTAKLYDETAENPTLAEFLEEVALVSDTDVLMEDRNCVTLMTVHSAKGLEFPVVFIAGFEEGLFPHYSSVAEGKMEEERRLAYVAITRAKEKLYVTFCASRTIYGRTDMTVPSTFLREIPDADKDQPGRPGRFGSRTGESPGIRSAREAPAAPASAGGRTVFRKGDRVRHPFFGTGEILDATPAASDVIYEIAFDSGSVKRIMASYAKLTPENSES